MNEKVITVLIPVYNEEEVLPQFYLRMSEVIQKKDNYIFELLFVNDGSKDNSQNIIMDFQNHNKNISAVNLSRNYGKEIAMAAGLDYAKGDAVIIIDADLQDPPELIHEMIEKWEEGFDDVYAQRTSRKGEGFLKKATSYLFYRILEKLTRVEIQKDTGDFRLLSRKAVESLKNYRESERYTKGLFSLIGFKKTAIKFEREPRAAGKTKWNYFKLIGLALEGITSFTTIPLRLSTYIGILFACISFIYMAYIIFKTLTYGDPVQGYPSLVSIVLFLGGIQLISLGIIGEYLGRTFIETKNRPLYFVQDYQTNMS